MTQPLTCSISLIIDKSTNLLKGTTMISRMAPSKSVHDRSHFPILIRSSKFMNIDNGAMLILAFCKSIYLKLVKLTVLKRLREAIFKIREGKIHGRFPVLFTASFASARCGLMQEVQVIILIS